MDELRLTGTELGVSLWLVPSAADAARLRKIMDTRPTSPSTSETSYPQFYPHITLASLPSNPEPSHEDILASIPPRQGALSVTFDRVEIGDHYFRSVYLAVRPSPDLLELHRNVHAALGIDSPRTPKYPHMSLCYISDEDAAGGERNRYFEALKEAGKVRQEGESATLNCGDSDEEDWLSGFQSSEIWIARCDGPVETWTIEKKLSLL